MFPTLALLRKQLMAVVKDKSRQGHVVDGLQNEIESLPDSYDALYAMARRLAKLPLRLDWEFVEPDDLETIWTECDPDRPTKPIALVDPRKIAPRVKAAFLASVCGCILGKPVEVDPTLEEIRIAAEAVGEWPIRDYIPEKMLEALGRRNPSWTETVRGRSSNRPGSRSAPWASTGACGLRSAPVP